MTFKLKRSASSRNVEFQLTNLFLSALISFTATFSFGQDFNYEYRNISGNSYAGAIGKSMVELNDGSCGLATVNSLFNDAGYTDCQITYLKPTGDIIASFTFGNPTGNETCNAVCNSIDFTDQFLLCGQSDNDQMLIMKVDLYGNVIWSKELTFSFANSEAITILPVYNNYNDRGYVVVGNSNSITGTNSVAAAKIDENGNVIWSKEYNMGVKMLMTDAIARHHISDRVISIVGFQQYSGIFYLNLYEGNGNIFYYPGANYALNAPIDLYNPQLAEVVDGNEYKTVISFQRNALSANSVGLYMFGINGYDDFTPMWAKHYEQVGVHGYINGDLITNSNDEIVLAGSLNTDVTNGGPFVVQIAHPFILNTDFSGNLLNYRDFDLGEYEFASSVLESCSSGEVAFNGSNLEYGVQWDLKVIKQNNPGLIECAEILDWTQIDEKVIESQLNMTMISVGTPANYSVDMIDQTLEKYDCFGAQVMRPIQNEDSYTVQHAIDKQGGTNESANNGEWFYPNPTRGTIYLNLVGNNTFITLYTISGEVVLKGVYNQGDYIDVTSLSSGIYFIERQGLDGMSERQKIIVQ